MKRPNATGLWFATGEIGRRLLAVERDTLTKRLMARLVDAPITGGWFVPHHWRDWKFVEGGVS